MPLPPCPERLRVAVQVLAQVRFGVGPQGEGASMRGKQKTHEIKLQIRRVLLEEWDPVGVADEPLAQDEYDSYLGGIYGLLAQSATEAEIVHHLYMTETLNMGMKGQSKERLLTAAQALKRIAL